MCAPLALRNVDIARSRSSFLPKRSGITALDQEKTPMTVTIRQLHPHFFGEVSGVDLRNPLTPQEARDIEAGMDKYAVLLFRNQDITDEQQLAFALNFGAREKARGGTVTKKEDYRLTSGLNNVSNLGKDGQPLPRDHRTHLFNLGNCLWTYTK